MKEKLIPPTVPHENQSPLVKQLLEFIEHQGMIIHQQAEEIQKLKDEIARLKKQPPRPKIKPSSLGKKKNDSSASSRKKRPGSKKKSKTAQLKIHETKPIEPENIPPGSQFKYYRILSFKILKSRHSIPGFSLRFMKHLAAAVLPGNYHPNIMESILAHP